MANKQIYELTTRTFDGDSLIPISVENTDPSTQAQYPQLAGKTTGNDVSDFVANTQQYSTDLDTEAKTLTGSINELHSSIGADAYDENETYNKGDTVIHNGTLYACKDNSVTGTWDASHWDATTLQPKIDNTLATTDKTVVGAINELNTVKQNIPTIITHSDRIQVGTSTESSICIKSISEGTYGVVARANLENSESGKYFTMKLYTGTTLRNELLTVIGAGVYPALTVASFFTISSTQNCTIKIQHNCTSASYSSGSLQIIKFA